MIHEVDFMTQSYKLLYMIENELRKVVIEKLHNEYGTHFEYIAPRKVLKRPSKAISSHTLHELISLFRIYPSLNNYFSPEQIRLLSTLPQIRNRIAHCHLITMDEYERLLKGYSILFQVPDKKELQPQ